MRSEAAIACCRLVFTRLNFLIGVYIMKAAKMNPRKLPCVVRPLRNLAAAVPDQANHRQPAEQLHQRRQHGDGARDLQVDAVEELGGALEALALVLLGAEGLDDAMAGEGFGGDVRETLDGFLAAAGAAAHALPQPDERIDDDRRAGHADQREAPIPPEQQRGIAEERQAFAQQVAYRLRHGLLDQVDVVGDPRHQRPRGPSAEERRRLVEDVPEQLVAQIAHDPLADVGHQVGREVRADAFRKVGGEHRARPERQRARIGQRAARAGRPQPVVDDRLDQVGHRGRGGGV